MGMISDSDLRSIGEEICTYTAAINSPLNNNKTMTLFLFAETEMVCLSWVELCYERRILCWLRQGWYKMVLMKNVKREQVSTYAYNVGGKLHILHAV